jgi:hypothetical protein
MLWLGTIVAVVFGSGYIIHFVGDRFMVRRGDLPIVTPTELRVWMVGAIVGIALVAYARFIDFGHLTSS